MVNVFYTHVDRLDTEYQKEFDDVEEAMKFYWKMKHLKDKRNGRLLYIVSYICTTEYEMKVMERIYK